MQEAIYSNRERIRQARLLSSRDQGLVHPGPGPRSLLSWWRLYLTRLAPRGRQELAPQARDHPSCACGSGHQAGGGERASPLTERCALAQHLGDGRLPLTTFSGALSAAWILKLLPWQTLGFQ